MYSTRFLSSYCLFTAAVSAFRSAVHLDRSDADTKAIADAFKKATAGMSEKDQKSVLEYLRWLIDQPRRFELIKIDRSSAERDLDYKLAKRGGWLIDDGGIIPADEFMARTGLTEEVLAEKVRERRLFKMPSCVDLVWSEVYYPSFFADPSFDPTLLEAASQALRAANGVRKYRFFTTPDPELGGKTPLNVLAEGDLERVLLAAKRFRRRAPQSTGPKE
jgi:hypothetical protein